MGLLSRLPLHVPPSPLVPGSLLGPDLLSPFQALGSTPVYTSLDALPITAPSQTPVA